MWDTAVNAALARCPFLQELVRKHGEDFARDMVLNPHEQHSAGEPLLDDSSSFSNAVSMFHGSNGLHPLPNFSELFSKKDDEVAKDQDKDLVVSTATGPRGASLYSILAKAPLAAISIAAPGMPGPGDWFRKKIFSNRDASSKLPRGRPSLHFSAAVGSAGLSAAGGCPLRKWLGPLAPMVFSSAGNLKCPEAIVQMRAALARSQPVRTLRPQALPLKFLAVGATAALVNIPFGALREQFEKFSPGWFLAVHATIPFIAMLRKAVIMPKFAIICTIAAAIAGQALGAKLAKARREQITEFGVSAVAVQSAAPALPPRTTVSPEEDRLRSKLQLVISDIQEKMKHSPEYDGHEYRQMEVTAVKV